MKTIREVIEELEKIETSYGNVEVYVSSFKDGGFGAQINVEVKEISGAIIPDYNEDFKFKRVACLYV